MNPTQVAAQTNLSVRRGASNHPDPQLAMEEIWNAVRQPDIALGMFFCSSTYDLDALGQAFREKFGETPLIGCTSAGEITPAGYLNGALTAVTISSKDFRLAMRVIPRLSEFEFARGQVAATETRADLEKVGTAVDGDNTFAFLLIDGLSMREEMVVNSIHRTLGSVPLFGGSAGDNGQFRKTWIFAEGKFVTDAAVLALIQPGAPFRIFKTQHFAAADQKLVVTRADAATRTVFEINGATAGREYAQMVGIDLADLSPSVFAAHPVVVKVGGTQYVRSIMRLNEDESITFACAIDEGIVLSVAEGVGLVENLEEAFANLRREVGPPQLILGCDCLFRAMEMDQRNLREAVGQLMMRNNVVGFATYGEQFNAMHVNQTFTGVAIGTPGGAAAAGKGLA